MSGHQKRSYPRNPHESPIRILIERDYATMKENYGPTHARMLNCDKGGLYFETDHALQSGQRVAIKVEDSVSDADQSDGAYTVHYAKVRWCRELDRTEGARYGIGVKITETVVQAEIR